MKTGLILEGGAMRGMYTAGVLDRDATLTVERPSFGNGTQAAEAGNSVSPGSLQQLTLPDAIPETEDGMIGFSQKVDDRNCLYAALRKMRHNAVLYRRAGRKRRKGKPTGEAGTMCSGRYGRREAAATA